MTSFNSIFKSIQKISDFDIKYSGARYTSILCARLPYQNNFEFKFLRLHLLPVATNAVSVSMRAYHVTSNARPVNMHAVSVTINALRVTTNAASVTTYAHRVKANARSVTLNAKRVSANAESVTTNALRVTTNAESAVCSGSWQLLVHSW